MVKGTGQVAALDRGVVVIVEVVQPQDFISPAEQVVSEVGSDESRRTGNQNASHDSVLNA